MTRLLRPPPVPRCARSSDAVKRMRFDWLALSTPLDLLNCSVTFLQVWEVNDDWALLVWGHDNHMNFSYFVVRELHDLREGR